MVTPRNLTLIASFVLFLPALAGCITGTDVNTAAVDDPRPASDQPRVVIAVIDTGINFYHSEYRRDAALTVDAVTGSPSLAARLPAGLEVTALPISLDIEDWADAVESDMDALMAMEPRTLYTFPGTKIAAAISFQNRPSDWPVILDRPGFYTHGTMTTSRATGNTVSIGGADADIDLVVIQGFSQEAVDWAAKQDWIDIVSISAGISPLSIVPGVPNALDEGAVEAYQALAHKKPFFASSGNGFVNAGLLGFPSWMRGSSGAPDVISVGANDNGRASQWHNFDSYIAADGCSNPAASPGDTEKIGNTGGGTSSATPFSAGGGAKMLLEARRILNDATVGVRVDDTLVRDDGAWDSLAPGDANVVLARGDAGLVSDGPLADGVFTLLEFKDVLYHSALAAPTDDESDGAACTTNQPAPGSAVPEPGRFALQGYGEVNGLSIDAALDVLRGESELPARAMDDREYVRAHTLKTTMAEST